MLRLVLGRGGSGKTEYVRRELDSLARNGAEKLLLLVPEQYSFESERAMLHLLGAKQVQRVQVSSFTRLADFVFRQLGGLAGRRLNDGGRSILMSLALDGVGEQLPLYRKHAQTPELVKLMLSASSELKMCAITPMDLSRTATQMEDGTLKEKTSELALVLSAYEALVARSYLDPLDDLTRLKNTLAGKSFFSGYTVMVDSFKGFTVQELEILEIIIRESKEAVITLCTDRLDDPEQGMGLFSLVRRTARQIIRLARENSIPVASLVLLESGRRFQGKGLAALEAGVFRTVRQEINENTGDTVVYAAKNSYDEVRFTASMIRSLVMEHGYRYRDFAVIVRSEETYRGSLDTALERWEIPCFLDRPRSIDSEPLMHLVLSAFKILKNGFHSDDVFAYLKTGLAGLSPEDISLLENYTFLWKLSGKRWKEEWKDHPKGFVGRFTDRDAEALQALNVLRERVTQPLQSLAKAVDGASGEGMAKAVYQLLLDLDVPLHLKNLCISLRDCNERSLAEQQLRLWDMLMEILDQMALVLKEEYLPHVRFAELLRLVIAAGELAAIPQGLDEVTVGVADRMRPAEPKVVFLLGASQGEFPLNPKSGGVFSDEERRALITLGLPLSDTLEQNAVEERFLAYAAMTSPSERLYVTYPLADLGGTAKSPSALVTEIQGILKKVPVLSEYTLKDEFFANAASPAFELTARLWKQNTTLSSSLKALFESRPEYAQRLKALDRAGSKAPVQFEDPTRARSLFESNRHISPSQIENYHLCRFQYFCHYGLGARERKPAEMDALEYGSLMHYLLENLLSKVGSGPLAEMDRPELKDLILEHISYYVEAKLGGSENRTPRFNFLFDRMADSAQVIIGRIARELRQSKFSPVKFELELKEGTEFPPLTIPLRDGQIIIAGKIDRVDVMEENGEHYLRVIDYKTGKKEFKLGDVLYGVNMQMLIYLAALIEQGKFTPAGVLYMPSTRPVISLARKASAADLEKEADKKLRMNGLVIGDEAVIRGMEEQAAGKYIPVALKDGKITRGENAVNYVEMNAIVDHLKKLVGDMAETLYSGDVDADPLKGDYDACRWCPYFPVCGHEKEDGGRELFQCDKAETLSKMMKKEEDQ